MGKNGKPRPVTRASSLGSTSRLAGLVATSELGPREIRVLLDAARAMSRAAPPPLLAGKTVVNLFFEPSTRTRLSFEFASRRLGASVAQFAAAASSAAKGETLADTARNIEALKPHCLVVRHASAGSPVFLRREVKVPVVNAGDGFHEHPTQALLDAYTIEEKLGKARGKKVVIIGDIAHSRVARSNIIVLRKLGAEVSVCGPPTLLPPRLEAIGVKHSYRPEPLLREADVVMCLRIQLERQNRMQIPSLAEYSRFWGLNRDRIRMLKRDAIVMAPGPVNYGVELDPEVAADPRSVILDQVANGVLVRMAVLAAVCAPDALDNWLRDKGNAR